MTKEEKLLSLLQPKDYKSKIKLYCNPYKIQNLVKKVGNVVEKDYICKIIKIEEL